MRKQSPPVVNDGQILTEIVDGKQGTRNTRLNNIKGQINSAYDNYLANGAYLGVMNPINLGKTQKKDMEHCYSAKTTGLSNLKEAIKNCLSAVDKELCPYCNLRDPCEFDHYLPKSRFQEFSIFSKNLIWSCHKCNHKKKEHFVPTDRYLNTYYDLIPDEQFLFCRIGLPIEQQGISFYFEKPTTITDRQYQDILAHARKLQLIETYQKMASSILPIWLQKWRGLYEIYGDADSTKQHIINDLRAEITPEEGKYGKNHYKVVLRKSTLAQINDIIDQFTV